MDIIKFKTEPNLFDVHAEFNTIFGIVMAALDSNSNIKKASIEKCFPNFVKMTNEINEKMQKYDIATELS